MARNFANNSMSSERLMADSLSAGDVLIRVSFPGIAGGKVNMQRYVVKKILSTRVVVAPEWSLDREYRLVVQTRQHSSFKGEVTTKVEGFSDYDTSFNFMTEDDSKIKEFEARNEAEKIRVDARAAVAELTASRHGFSDPVRIEAAIQALQALSDSVRSGN